MKVCQSLLKRFFSPFFTYILNRYTRNYFFFLLTVTTHFNFIRLSWGEYFDYMKTKYHLIVCFCFDNHLCCETYSLLLFWQSPLLWNFQKIKTGACLYSSMRKTGCVNPFHAPGLFLQPLKILENVWFSVFCCSRGMERK